MSVSFNQNNPYFTNNVKSANKPDESVETSFKGSDDRNEKTGMSTTAKCAASSLVTAGLVLAGMGLWGRYGNKAAKESKKVMEGVSELASERFGGVGKFVETTLEGLKNKGVKFDKGRALTKDGAGYTGKYGKILGENGKYNIFELTNGNRTKLSRFENAKLRNTVEYEYNQANKISKIIETDVATGKKTVKNFTYDGNGKLSKVVNEDALGVAQSSKEFLYDANGKLAKVSRTDAGQTPEIKEFIRKDDKLSEIVTKAGKNKESMSFVRNKEGKVSESIRKDILKNEVLEKKEFSYSGEKLSKIVKKDAADKIVETKEFVYSDNKLAQTLIKNDKNEIIKSVKVERDAHGDVSKIIKEGSSVGENRVVEHDIAGKTVKEFDSGDKTTPIREVKLEGEMSSCFEKGQLVTSINSSGAVGIHSQSKLPQGLDCEVYITRFNQQGFSLKDGDRRISCVLSSNGEYCVTENGKNTYLKKDQIEGCSKKLKELIDHVAELKKSYDNFVKV